MQSTCFVWYPLQELNLLPITKLLMEHLIDVIRCRPNYGYFHCNNILALVCYDNVEGILTNAVKWFSKIFLMALYNLL